ncbi:cyclic lactone autoinducer peptide [Paenibacillus gansuensis]|uniref:Cyclic lactone autoinducer peptide n=1 Tax=Paenibacillus gansuensis TaxID=306542 RepID=A0ABW5PEI2_9BACL
MKRVVAKYLSIILMAIGSFFLFTNSFFYYRPETPTELLKNKNT